jgi:hypothetical protein
MSFGPKKYLGYVPHRGERARAESGGLAGAGTNGRMSGGVGTTGGTFGGAFLKKPRIKLADFSSFFFLFSASIAVLQSCDFWCSS